MNKRYENKFNYDPARLRHRISIIQLVPTQLPDSSTDIIETEYLPTKAGIERINDFNQQQIQAGLSSFRGDKIFVIRNRIGINITTDMVIDHGYERYEIVGFVPQDDPKTFIKIACSKLKDLTT